MKSFYGPFFEGKDGAWHWRRECPDFPTNENPKMMVSSSFPDKIELCEHCTKLDENDTSGKRMAMKN